MTNVLQQKAVIADVVIRHWTGRKLDRRITDETNTQHGAEADAGRYNKLIIDQAAFSELFQICGDARRKHFLMTMPWSDSGYRILPTELYGEFSNTFRNLRSEFDSAADSFARLFPNHKAARKRKLGSMYNEMDYPDPAHVRDMFSFKVSIHPCPDADDFRVSLAKEHVADMRSELEAELRTTLNEALKEPIRRIVTVVDKMVVKLKAYKPKTETSNAENTFRNSLVTNIQDLLPLLEAFNLTGDKNLTNLTKRVEQELCSQDPDVLREDAGKRAKVAKAAEEILKQANALMA